MLQSINDIELVVATVDEDGRPCFVDAEPLTMTYPDVASIAYLWASDGTLRIPDSVGAVPTHQTWIPDVGGTRVRIICFAPHSAGKSPAPAQAPVRMDPKTHHDDSDPGMHWTHTVDYEFILSGKIDLVLPGGHVKTVRQGSCVIMGGAPHAWRNRYDEPCLYAAVLIGAEVKDKS